MKNKKIALIGSANCGKTTLFNTLTHSRYATVNYPGATVTYEKGFFHSLDQKTYEIIDTPGLQSLEAYTEDEKVTLSALFDQENQPEAILCIADSNQLSRHLLLCRQIILSGFECALLITMNDELEEKGLGLNKDIISANLGIPVLTIDPRSSNCVRDITSLLENFCYEKRSPQRPPIDSSKYLNWFSENDKLYLSALEEIPKQKKKRSFDADKYLLHSIWGLFIFTTIMTLVFASVYWLAAPLMDLIDSGSTFILNFLENKLPNSFFSKLFNHGLIAGFGAILVFVPQIFILFIAMGFLENSGYLARGAALIDKPLSKIGLNGKSFLPLLSGYACSIPAMLATRTINSPKERMITLFIIPLMSCSARLPVYSLMILFLVGENNSLMGGLFLTLIYMSSLIVGGVVAGIIHKFSKKSTESEFTIELPTLRKPILKHIFFSSLNKLMDYLKKAGPTIAVISILLWFFTHFPYDSEKSEVEIVHNSWAAKVGLIIEPVSEGMGLDWRGAIALISGFAAREVFVSSLALVYQLDLDEEEDEEISQTKLITSMREAKNSNGDLIFTTSSVLGILLFYLIALQCFPTVAVAKKEFASTKLALIQVFVFTIGAWILATILVQSLRFLGFS
jgi:ferrous iron transport protein B